MRLLLLACVFSFSLTASFALGPSDCAGCTLIISIIDGYADSHNTTVTAALDDICRFLPTPVNAECYVFAAQYGEIIVQMLTDEFTPDDVCQALPFCPNHTCRLWPPSRMSAHLDAWLADPPRALGSAQNVMRILTAPPPSLRETPWQWILSLINKLSHNHTAVVDLDGDSFSTIATLRGYNWRGADCSDSDPTIKPGRRVSAHPPSVDYNCNGIAGTFANGTSYESLYCGASQSIGVVVMGDSAGAHFEFPPQWFTPSQINASTYSDMLSVLSDEVDVPHRSWVTGWQTNTSAMVDSLYLRMRERNLCMHRDFQNIGVNGADSGSILSFLDSLRRDPAHDQPVLIVWELVGNDVCGHRHDFTSMTSVEAFRANTIEAMRWHDAHLPRGSHVLLVGLAQGGYLWEFLSTRTHPLGVSYPAFYDYLNCLEISPCWGWMNSNATVRELTTQHAQALTQVYLDLLANTSITFENITLGFMPFQFENAYMEWLASGGEGWQLVEPVDGFHPNQISNALMGRLTFEYLLANYTEWLPPQNPYNSLISQRFGDQGGYAM